MPGGDGSAVSRRILRPHHDQDAAGRQGLGGADPAARLQNGDARVVRVATRRQHVARPEEACDGGVGRPAQDGERQAALVHAAGDHDDALVGESEGLVAVVCHVQDTGRCWLATHAAQHLLQRLARLRVDGAERLVEQERARPGSERSRQGHALALAAGQHGRPAVRNADAPTVAASRTTSAPRAARPAGASAPPAPRAARRP